jgi:hypothetical protein
MCCNEMVGDWSLPLVVLGVVTDVDGRIIVGLGSGDAASSRSSS